jgi:hypothetical protein
VVSLGNSLCEESRRQHRAGSDAVPPDAIRKIVGKCAQRFGDSQLAQCSNQVAADMMPKNAALQNYSEVYTGTQAYISQVGDEMRALIRSVGIDRFDWSTLEGLRDLANAEWSGTTDLPTVLWQNGLLGYVGDDSRPVFYSLGDADQFRLPEEYETYLFHPCMIDSANIASVGPDPIAPF